MPSHWHCCVTGCQSNWRNWKKYHRTPCTPDILMHYRIFYGSLIKWDRQWKSICSKHWSKPRKSFREIPDIRIPDEYQCRQRKEVISKVCTGLACETTLNDLVFDQQRIAAFIENNCGKCLHEALEVDVAGHDYVETVTIAKHKLYLALSSIPHMPTANDPEESDSDSRVDDDSNESVGDVQKLGSSEGIVVKMEHTNYVGDEINEADQHKRCAYEETDCGNIQSNYETEERKSRIGESKADEGKVLQSLYRMQKEGELCDFTIIARGTNNKLSVLKVHKVVLAAISDKIKLLKDDFINAYKKLNVADALRIIEFAYTRNINYMAELSARERRRLEDAATFLGVSLCVNYIRSFTNVATLSLAELDQFMAPTPLSDGSDSEVLRDMIETKFSVPALSKGEKDCYTSPPDAVARTLDKELNPFEIREAGVTTLVQLDGVNHRILNTDFSAPVMVKVWKPI